jgi:thioredoxin-like negative regulator of GroEL
MHLKAMVEEMPANFSQVKFAIVDCDEAQDLVDHFEDVESVPSLVMVHPHKMAFETVSAPAPEALT